MIYLSIHLLLLCEVYVYMGGPVGGGGKVSNKMGEGGGGELRNIPQKLSTF